MNKNVKSMFFVVTLLTLLVAVSAVSASDVSEDTPIADSLQDNVVSDVTQAASDNAVVAEQTTVTSSDNNVETTKNLEKEDKGLKKDSVTIDGVEYDTVLENQVIVERRTVNPENENMYINNCSFNYVGDEGYSIIRNDGKILYINNISHLDQIGLRNYGENSIMIINNTYLDYNYDITNRAELYIYNSTIDCYIVNENKIYIDELSTMGEHLTFETEGEIIYINPSGIYEGNNTIENRIISSDIINNGNLTIINSTLNSKIKNNGKLIISDDVIFGENFKIEGDGEIIINDYSKIITYLTSLNGNYTITNATFDKGFNFYGDILLVNCTITKEYAGVYYNYGILNLKNCTININNNIQNYNIIIIDDDTQIISGNIQGNGTVFYGERPESFNPTEFNGDNTIENMTFNLKSTNNGNLVLINCNITESITNNGNLTVINSSFSNNDIIIINNLYGSDTITNVF